MNHIEPLNTSKVANCQPEFRECEFSVLLLALLLVEVYLSKRNNWTRRVDLRQELLKGPINPMEPAAPVAPVDYCGSYCSS